MSAEKIKLKMFHTISDIIFAANVLPIARVMFSTDAIFDFLYFPQIFYIPMALFIPPSIFAVNIQFNLLYQFWIHTEVTYNYKHLGSVLLSI